VIDVSGKATTLRTATASACLKTGPATIGLIEAGKIPKGDPLAVARVAAVQAAKNTSRIIPFCHPMPIEFVGVEFTLGDGRIDLVVTVKAIYRTGVEMEALTGASVAALTLYDMMKMLDKEMEIVGVRLESKRGGKSDFGRRPAGTLRAAVLVASDSVAAGKAEDRSGRLIVERLEKEGIVVAGSHVLPDDREALAAALIELADGEKVDLVITTGGTGCGPRDLTPEATADVIERELPGVAEAVRGFGQARMPRAMLSRGRAGIRGGTVIVNLPGSARAVEESLNALFPGVIHTFPMLRGEGHPAAGEGKA
jgi:cyclic pyranopterin monophosphate synthase